MYPFKITIFALVSNLFSAFSKKSAKSISFSESDATEYAKKSIPKEENTQNTLEKPPIYYLPIHLM